MRIKSDKMHRTGVGTVLQCYCVKVQTVYSSLRTAVLQCSCVNVQTVYSALCTAVLQCYCVYVQTVYSAVCTAVLLFYIVKVQTVYSAVRTTVLLSIAPAVSPELLPFTLISINFSYLPTLGDMR